MEENSNHSLSMKKIVSYFCILICFTFFYSNTSYGADTPWDACESKNGYDRYTCRVQQLCEKYDSKKPVWRWDGYEDAESYREQTEWLQAVAFERVKQIYRTNIGNIYKCALINSQKKTLKTFQEKLVSLDKTWTLQDKLWRQMDSQIQKADITGASIGCQNIENKNIYNKLNILQESTLEMCKYVTYLEYLQDYYKELPNLVWNGWQHEEVKYGNQEVADALWWIQAKIEIEKQHSLKVMPMAFHAYWDYENNLPAHILLQIIKEDYVIIREKLYKAFNPISQVVYKISNAMQK